MQGVVWAVENFHLYFSGSEFLIAKDHKPLLKTEANSLQPSAYLPNWQGRRESSQFYEPLSKHHRKWGAQHCRGLSELCMQPGCAKSNDTAINQVIDGEGHSALGTYQGHWEWPVDTFRSTRVQKYETWTIGLPRNFTEGKQDLSPKSSERQSRGPCTGWTPRAVKTKRRIRGKVWFSGVDNVVKEEVDNCLPCQAATNGKAERLKPVKTTTLPSTPWKELALDFVRPLRSGEYLTVATTEYSRIPEAEIVASTSAGSTIQKLDAIFDRQGIPHVLKSDNGPPSMAWNSRTFVSIWAFDTAKKRLFGQDQWRRGMFHDDTSEMHESRHRWAQKLETITIQVSLTVSGDTPLNYWHHTVQST